MDEIINAIEKHDIDRVVYVAAERPSWTQKSVVKTMITDILNVLEAIRLTC